MNYTDVLVIGNGLSGLALGQELNTKGIDHIILETNPFGVHANLHYLTSSAAAESLGISDHYETQTRIREPITGYTRYNATSETLEILEGIEPSKENRDGFVTFSLEDLRNIMSSDSVHWNRTANIFQYDKNWEVTTSEGEKYNSQIIIDATGANANIIKKICGEEVKESINDRTIRICYGAKFEYHGPENQLLFADKFPELGKDIPRETAGYVMPLGNELAEIVVATELTYEKKREWLRPELEALLKSYVEWYNDKGIEINYNNRSHNVTGFFSQELLDFRKIPTEKGVAAFGESLGLNHPLNGYLIYNISQYAKIMTDEISTFLETNNWTPHRKLVSKSPVNFGQQTVLSRKKIKSSQFGKGRSEATKDIHKALHSTVGDDGIWNGIDNGIPLTSLLIGACKNPASIVTLLELGVDYASLLMSNSLYREELTSKKNKK